MNKTVVLNPDGLDVTKPIWVVMVDGEPAGMFYTEEMAYHFLKTL